MNIMLIYVATILVITLKRWPNALYNDEQSLVYSAVSKDLHELSNFWGRF